VLGIAPGTLIAFLITAFVVIAIPGPSVLFIVSRALANGRRVAMWTMLGNTTGVYGLVIAIAFGMGAIAEHSLVLFTIMKLVGGVYLVYLGVKTFRERGNLAAVVGQQVSVKASDGRSFRDGVLVGLANPKAIVFMAAILPQFVSPAAGHVALQILLLGLIFCLVAIISDGSWAMAAGAARKWFTRSPRRLEIIGGAGGLAIAVVGISLLLLKRK
jgi:threonine/homoserine/homoserine lactone efflux protein